MKDSRRKQAIEAKARRKAERMKAEHTSNYARKHRYLKANGGFGFEYAEPKPWKS